MSIEPPESRKQGTMVPGHGTVFAVVVTETACLQVILTSSWPFCTKLWLCFCSFSHINLPTSDIIFKLVLFWNYIVLWTEGQIAFVWSAYPTVFPQSCRISASVEIASWHIPEAVAEGFRRLEMEIPEKDGREFSA